MQLIQGDLFRDFARLKLIIPHGGGAVRGIDPETGHYFDDTRRYVDASGLSAADKRKIFEGNAKKVYSRWRG